jgi:hypothetical protein
VYFIDEHAIARSKNRKSKTIFGFSIFHFFFYSCLVYIMPVHAAKDSKGSYYQWGSQKKYYYIVGNAKSRAEAKRKAILQGTAIKARPRSHFQ